MGCSVRASGYGLARNKQHAIALGTETERSVVRWAMDEVVERVVSGGRARSAQGMNTR